MKALELNGNAKVIKKYYRDGAEVTIAKTDSIKGRYLAFVNFGEKITVLMATFPTLLRAKVDVDIKEHYSNVIANLAKTAREINESARRNRMRAA